MNKLSAIIIDDELDSINLLQLELKRSCPSIGFITTFNNPQKALQEIPVLRPDVIFLDVEMPNMNGFELLEKLVPLQFHVIFVTAFNQYAIKSFKFNALDYLLKPVDCEDLKRAVTKAEEKVFPDVSQIVQAWHQHKGAEIRKLALPSQNGVTFVSLIDIVYVEASDNYTRIVCTDGNVQILSKTLKDVQQLLEESHFLRVHRQFIVNLNHVQHLNRQEGLLKLSFVNLEIPIVRSQYDRFLKKFYKV